MDIQKFFDHWNLSENPFQAEEALHDSVYQRIIEGSVTHPAFAKILGDPAQPGTTIVFGEKGSGKTAIRLMLDQRFRAFNEEHDENRTWIVRYDEHNPMLDSLSTKLRHRSADKTVRSLRLADHQDSILSRAVTGLVDMIMKEEGDGVKSRPITGKFTRQQRVDLATLALLYDQPERGEGATRWKKMKSLRGVAPLLGRSGHGIVVLVFALLGLVAGLAWWAFGLDSVEWKGAAIAGGAGFVIAGGWWLLRNWRNAVRGRRLDREIRVVNRLRGVRGRRLWNFKSGHFSEQPIPRPGDTESRYNLTGRLLHVLEALGYDHLVVLVDRVDEPVLVNGDERRIKAFVWPLMNNKFLQQQNLGVKMLLPLEVGQQLNSEDTEFKKAARLDKQSVVNPLNWTGETLYDLCAHRFQNCQKDGGEQAYGLKDIFADEVSSKELIDALDQMHQPRDAFKFLYALMVEHCQNTSTESENYQISQQTLNQVRREQGKRVIDLYRGAGAN